MFIITGILSIIAIIVTLSIVVGGVTAEGMSMYCCRTVFKAWKMSNVGTKALLGLVWKYRFGGLVGIGLFIIVVVGTWVMIKIITNTVTWSVLVIAALIDIVVLGIIVWRGCKQ